MTYTAFDQLIGAAGGSARRYCLPPGDSARRIPAPPAMTRIWLVTAGMVAPNDFYRLPKLRAPPAKFAERQGPSEPGGWDDGEPVEGARHG